MSPTARDRERERLSPTAPPALHNNWQELASQPSKACPGHAIQTDPARLPDGWWREVFNSDAAIYGGGNIGNFASDVPASAGRIQVRVSAKGVLIAQAGDDEQILAAREAREGDEAIGPQHVDHVDFLRALAAEKYSQPLFFSNQV